MALGENDKSLLSFLAGGGISSLVNPTVKGYLNPITASLGTNQSLANKLITSVVPAGVGLVLSYLSDSEEAKLAAYALYGYAFAAITDPPPPSRPAPAAAVFRPVVSQPQGGSNGLIIR